MKWMKSPHLVSVLLVGLAGAAIAEPVTFRFPDTSLLSPPGDDEGKLSSSHGEVMVTGSLLIAPCVLSDYALESQQRGWLPATTQQLTLALEGCGMGAWQAGLMRSREVAFPVRSRWGASEYRSLRLHDGVNYLTIGIGASTRYMRLEIDYE